MKTPRPLTISILTIALSMLLIWLFGPVSNGPTNPIEKPTAKLSGDQSHSRHSDQQTKDIQREAQVAFDDARSRDHSLSRSEKYRILTNKALNGAPLRRTVAAWFKKWNLDEVKLDQTLDVLREMDDRYMEEDLRFERSTPSEVGDRTDSLRVAQSKQQHATNYELIAKRTSQKLFELLGSEDRVEKVKEIKFKIASDMLTQIREQDLQVPEN